MITNISLMCLLKLDTESEWILLDNVFHKVILEYLKVRFIYSVLGSVKQTYLCF